MWIFTKVGFASIVAHRTMPDRFLVRGRRREDLERIKELAHLTAPIHQIQGSPHADYPFRFQVRRRGLRRLLLAAAGSVDYPNFKSEVTKVQGSAAHDAYMGVWSVMRRFEAPRPLPKFDDLLPGTMGRRESWPPLTDRPFSRALAQERQRRLPVMEDPAVASAFRSAERRLRSKDHLHSPYDDGEVSIDVTLPAEEDPFGPDLLDSPTCRTCGYILTAEEDATSPDRCPTCGEAR